MKTDFFFTIRAAEDEHRIIEDIIRQECEACNLNISYYRKLLRLGRGWHNSQHQTDRTIEHHQSYRECKISCPPERGWGFLRQLIFKYGSSHKILIDNLERLEYDEAIKKSPMECWRQFMGK